MLVDLRARSADLTGADAEKWLEKAGVIVNKNGIPNDPRPPMVTSGLRLGTPALTTRGLKEAEMELVAAWIDRVLGSSGDAAVIAAVRTLAHELRDVDICVNNLIPGVSATGIWGSEEATPQIARDPALAYPTARFLATVPPGGPTGQTWFDMERWPMWKDFDA